MPNKASIPTIVTLAAILLISSLQANPINSSQGSSSTQEETMVFFIPEKPGDEQLAYIFDTERNHLLVSSNHDGPIPKGLPRDRSFDEWVVLPGNVRAYTMPSLESTPSEVVLGYPQKIHSVATGFAKSDGGDWIAFKHNDTIFYLPLPLVAKRAVDKISGNYPIGKEQVDRDHPLPVHYRPDDLVKVNQRWNFHGPDYPKLLRAEAGRLIEEMLETARKQGIQIRIFSAFRSYARQRYLYLKKIRQEGLTQILVAKPGHSEHQLGTAVDLCSPDPGSVASADFGDSREGDWLKHHARDYGFIQSYRRDNSCESGYIPEPWHYRYLGKRPPP